MPSEKEQVLEFLTGKTGKSKFYFSDFCKIFPDKKQHEVKESSPTGSLYNTT